MMVKSRQSLMRTKSLKVEVCLFFRAAVMSVIYEPESAINLTK